MSDPSAPSDPAGPPEPSSRPAPAPSNGPPVTRRRVLLLGVGLVALLALGWGALPLLGAEAMRRRFALAVLRSRMSGLGFSTRDYEAFADDYAASDDASAWRAWLRLSAYPIYRWFPGMPGGRRLHGREIQIATRFLMRSTFFMPARRDAPRYLGTNPYEATPCMNPFVRRTG